MAIMVTIASGYAPYFYTDDPIGYGSLIPTGNREKRKFEEIARKEPLRCFTQRVLRAHRVMVVKLIPAQPILPIAAQSILLIFWILFIEQFFQFSLQLIY